jgi:hypothetical protein
VGVLNWSLVHRLWLPAIGCQLAANRDSKERDFWNVEFTKGSELETNY